MPPNTCEKLSPALVGVADGGGGEAGEVNEGAAGAGGGEKDGDTEGDGGVGGGLIPWNWRVNSPGCGAATDPEPFTAPNISVNDGAAGGFGSALAGGAGAFGAGVGGGSGAFAGIAARTSVFASSGIALSASQRGRSRNVLRKCVTTTVVPSTS